MSQANKAESPEQMRTEYDIRGGVRGKYYERYQQGTNVVRLDPDVAAVFHDAAAVNQALRMLIQVARRQVKEATTPLGQHLPRCATASRRYEDWNDAEGSHLSCGN
jgi:hypothetical protein